MLLLHHGTPRDARAREPLAAALPDGAEVAPADDRGPAQRSWPAKS
jgi:hypothetical protein